MWPLHATSGTPYGVPPGAKFKAEAVVGAAGVPGESVTVADFASQTTDGERVIWEP